MTLIEYIEYREEILNKQIEGFMSQDTIKSLDILLITKSQMELEKIKVAIEEGIIE